jgi:NAD(P)-dependent dehydrogenase (short-subunit alcohol dehydrogenase family)
LVDINVENAQKGVDVIAKRFPDAKALAMKADVGKENEVKAAVDRAVGEWGRLDIMVSPSCVH